MLVCCVVSHTAVQPTTPTHTQIDEGIGFCFFQSLKVRLGERQSTHPIILGQLPGDVAGAAFHSARMAAVLEQKMVFQGPDLPRRRQDVR